MWVEGKGREEGRVGWPTGRSGREDRDQGWLGEGGAS